jgi:hypothetical protein
MKSPATFTSRPPAAMTIIIPPSTSGGDLNRWIASTKM